MIQQNGTTLAYIGDACYELYIRQYLIDQKLTKVNELHKEAIRFTSAVGQAKAAKILWEQLYTEEEKAIYKRGRNQSANRKPKNADIATYHASTGFEAVLGYHYLNQQTKRLETIIEATISILE